MAISLLILALVEWTVICGAVEFLKRKSLETLSIFVHKAASLLMELVTNPLSSWLFLATGALRYARAREAYSGFSLHRHTHGISRST